MVTICVIHVDLSNLGNYLEPLACAGADNVILKALDFDDNGYFVCPDGSPSTSRRLWARTIS